MNVIIGSEADVKRVLQSEWTLSPFASAMTSWQIQGTTQVRIKRAPSADLSQYFHNHSIQVGYKTLYKST
jgi:hypothetical protein